MIGTSTRKHEVTRIEEEERKGKRRGRREGEKMTGKEEVEKSKRRGEEERRGG
jgi:hypothetical protein